MRSRTSRPSLVVATFAALALLLAACGGDDGRPSASELRDRILATNDGSDSDTSEEEAQCIGDAFADSDISDGGLRRIVDADEDQDLDDLGDFGLSEEDQAAAQEVFTEVFQDCIDFDLDLDTGDLGGEGAPAAEEE